MESNDELYLDIGITRETDVDVPLETYIAAFVLAYVETSGLDIWLIRSAEVSHPFSLATQVFKHLRTKCINREDLPEQVQNCCRPAVRSADCLTYVGGLCAILRWAVKVTIHKKPYHPCKELLGFRGGCLVACAESSIWTKFCEVDLPQATKQFAESAKAGRVNVPFLLPEELLKLEAHLKQPVKTHNILKRKQDLKKIITEQNCSDRSNKCNNDNFIEENVQFSETGLSLLIDSMKLSVDCDPVDMQLHHIYMEGIDLSLADLVLLPCVQYFLTELVKKTSSVGEYLPLLMSWYERLLANHRVLKATRICGWISLNHLRSSELTETAMELIIPHVAQQSLYSRDPTRSKTKVKCRSPSSVINVLKAAEIYPVYDLHPCLPNTCLNWNALPAVAHPAGGDLPLSRVKRKCQQLESLVTAVIKIALPGQTIVDFCAGGGHSGLLLAHQLPYCKVVMVENKEASLDRARSRAKDLHLENVAFFQCNLDYFQGNFDVGVTLHACGVATDLVINQCLQQNASFVCCPCCYGAIKETHLIQYPRSKKYKDTGISYQDFELLSHCADRTEKNTPTYEQGKYCMGLIDMDRIYLAKENNYEVKLCTLQPPSCSPKNHLLIGTPLVRATS